MKLKEFVYKHNNKWFAIGAAGLALVGVILIFSQYFGAISLADDKALDMLFSYDKTTFYEVLHLLDESDRLAYKLIHLADYVFILGMYPLISIGLSKELNRSHAISYLVLLPLAAGLFDLLENLMMDIHLYSFPSELMFLGALSGIFTTAKYLFLYASVGALVVFGFVKLMKGLRPSKLS